MRLSGDVLWEGGEPASTREVLHRSRDGRHTVVNAPKPYTVPMALRPENVDRYFRRDGKTGDRVDDPVLNGIREALERMNDVAGSMLSTRMAILENRTETIGRRAIQNAEKMRDMAHAVAPRIDKAREQAGRVLAHLESEMAVPQPRDPLERLAQMEARQRLAQMSEAERMSTIARSDDFLLAALNSDPAYSGMNPHKHKYALLKWRRKHHADKLQHIDRLQAADKALGDAADRFMDFTGELAKHPELEAAGRTDRAARQALDTK